MANVSIKFNGKEFLLSCEDGQEEHLEELSQNLSEKFNQLKSKLGNLGEASGAKHGCNRSDLSRQRLRSTHTLVRRHRRASPGGTGFNCADYLRLALLPRGCWQRPSFRRVPARNSPPAPVCLCQLAGPVA